MESADGRYIGQGTPISELMGSQQQNPGDLYPQQQMNPQEEQYYQQMQHQQMQQMSQQMPMQQPRSHIPMHVSQQEQYIPQQEQYYPPRSMNVSTQAPLSINHIVILVILFVIFSSPTIISIEKRIFSPRAVFTPSNYPPINFILLNAVLFIVFFILALYIEKNYSYS